jgi:preprotein translocase subunit SecD
MSNQYPLWKNLLILALVVLGLLYALPNLYGEVPAVQISGMRGAQADSATVDRVEAMLKRAELTYSSVLVDETGIKVRFADTETQLRAKDVVQEELGTQYTVALNLLSAAPAWLRAINAQPMYLGLDLRGGVYFLMQVDMPAAIRRAEERYVEDLRQVMQTNRIRYLTVSRLESGGIDVRFRDAAQRDKAAEVIGRELTDLVVADARRGDGLSLFFRLSEPALREKRNFALDQNITALRKRVDELGVAEPVIQQQGDDRIVVQLPGVQDTARAKEILGRTATLEIMMVDEDRDISAALAGQVPPGSRIYRDRRGAPILLKKPVIYSGDNIVDAAAGFDQQGGGAVVHITLDARGADKNERITRDNVGKRMAVVYIETKSEVKRDEQGRPVLDEEGREVRVRERIEEVITAPVIREQLGKRFQISGLDSVEEARDLALLLRAGALAAPIDIVEERTVGPSLGAENIERGFHSTWIGFAAISAFIIVYYAMFGVTAVLALAINVVLLVALLSLLQATLTLPGMAAIALTVGMAIDTNVLINERIREELRAGNTPQASIYAGYERAFGTILDSNITTLIAGVALFMFGSGPVRGFAVVLCLGILTSMFSGVMVSRALVNLTFGRRRRLQHLPIGNVAWK